MSLSIRCDVRRWGLGGVVLFGLMVVSRPENSGWAAPPRDTRWMSTQGEWSDVSRWTAGGPDASSRAAIHGASEVRVSTGDGPSIVGGLRIGTAPDDMVRLRIDGGALVCRRDFLHIGEASGGTTEIVVDDGALECVSAVYLGGAGNCTVGACRAELRIRGGSFVGRLLTIGWGVGSEATLAIEGSHATAVHLLDYVTLGVPGAGTAPSTATLRFTLDERGVTPVTIQSRRTGLQLSRKVAGNRCRLRVELAGVPPRDDVTLVAAHVPTQGTFDDLPEGSDVVARHAGIEYCWRLTYCGGISGCDVVLTRVRGHAADAPVTKCRARPAQPMPLWESIPPRPVLDDRDVPLAFDGAEGFGRQAIGGRCGSTVWVENLHDAGPGSFRAAVQARGPRVVEFRVGGVIELKSDVAVAEPFLTVNGQSAPNGGITLRGGGMIVRTHDVILRHFRIRPGDSTHDTDALWFHDAERCLADHLSLSWGTDEVLSVTGMSDAITVQWCIISEGLNRTQHGYASIAGGERVTWHHNLFAHHVSRVPRFAGITHCDFRNNVLYNWGHTAGYGQFERLNYVGNLLLPGPSTTQRPTRLHHGDETVGDGALYLADNELTDSAAATKDNWLAVGFEPRVRAAQPFPAPPVRTTNAADAFEAVLRDAGAFTPQRDTTDDRVLNEVRTRSGRIIIAPIESDR